jgi:hypothetical protein
MRLREMTVQELLAICRRKLAQGKTRFNHYLPPHTLPPGVLKAYKKTVLRDDVAGVDLEVFCKPSSDGGWLLKIYVREVPFNTLPLEVLRQASSK